MTWLPVAGRRGVLASFHRATVTPVLQRGAIMDRSAGSDTAEAGLVVVAASGCVPRSAVKGVGTAGLRSMSK